MSELSETPTLKKLEAGLTERLAAKEGHRFDPISIILIIVGIIQIIQRCYMASPSALRNRPLAKLRLVVAFRRESPEWTLAQCREHADLVMSMAQEATDEELAALIDECKER